MRRSPAVILQLLLAAGSASGQTAIFVEGGMLSGAGISEFQAGLRGSPATLSGAGLDFSAATLPTHFSDGIVLVVADLDATIHRPLSSIAAVAVRVGGTAAFGARGGGAGAGFGVNAGAGMIFSLGSRLLLRLDFTHRWLMSDGSTLGVSSFTLGFGVGG